jgi:hypothetical protein
MTVLGINLTTGDPTYDWSDIKPTHQRPAYVVEAAEKADKAWKDYLSITDFEPIPVEKLEKARLFAISCDTRYHEAYLRWQNELAKQLHELSLNQATPDFEITPNSPQYRPLTSPADLFVEEGDAKNLQTTRLALQGQSAAG